jgi:hypothetical protein
MIAKESSALVATALVQLIAVSASPQEVSAVAYSWAVRQYRYDTADHGLARSLLVRTAGRLRY